MTMCQRDRLENPKHKGEERGRGKRGEEERSGMKNRRGIGKQSREWEKRKKGKRKEKKIQIDARKENNLMLQ